VQLTSSEIRDRQEDILRKHEETMAASHDHMAEASRLYREAVDKHMVSLQMSVQSTTSLAQSLKVEADKVKRKILSAHVTPSLKLDDKELGFVKQLKELQSEHR
jgi:hypothetical protein